MKNLTLLALLATITFTGCQKTEEFIPATNNQASNKVVKETINSNVSSFGEGNPINYCGDITEVKLLAGQHIEVGNVLVFNDETNLYVTYNLTGDWNFGTLHLYVGSLEDVPKTKKGSPIPGHFPYTADVNGSATSYTFTIPLANLPECYIVAAHAEVNGIGNETAWGFGPRFVCKGNWATYFNDCKDLCQGEPPL